MDHQLIVQKGLVESNMVEKEEEPLIPLLILSILLAPAIILSLLVGRNRIRRKVSYQDGRDH
jgi:hypothetical protein